MFSLVSNLSYDVQLDFYALKCFRIPILMCKLYGCGHFYFDFIRIRLKCVLKSVHRGDSLWCEKTRVIICDWCLLKMIFVIGFYLLCVEVFNIAR